MRPAPTLGVMLYSKPTRSVEEQVELLYSRGLTGDHTLMHHCLSMVNYYRLSGYWKPFLNRQTEQFYPGVDFSTIWNRYLFDRSLRLLLLGGIERIEVATRTRLTQSHAMEFGPFGYTTDPRSLPKPSPQERTTFLDRIRAELEDAHRNEILIHFNTKYASEHDGMCPLRMACEVMRLGTLVKFLDFCSHKTLKDITSVFSVPDEVFRQWLKGLNTVRNMCAHHERVWNRVFGVKPWIPRFREYPNWHEPVKFTNDRLFIYLTIINFCLHGLKSNADWKENLLALLNAYPDIPKSEMGFPQNWQKSPLWII